jgi:hypothetical protein
MPFQAVEEARGAIAGADIEANGASVERFDHLGDILRAPRRPEHTAALAVQALYPLERELERWLDS